MGMKGGKTPSGRVAVAFRRINPAIASTIALIGLLFGIGTVLADRFGTVSNVSNIFRYSAPLLFASLGQTLVILTGGIDLSIGSIISLAAVLTSGQIDGKPEFVVPVVVGVLLLGLLIGLLNGFLVNVLKVHPLIITLGMSAILQGVALLYSMNPVGSVPPEFEDFAFGTIVGLPFGAMVGTLLLISAGLALKYTRVGRQFYAVGSNRVSAQLAGLSVNRVTLLAFAFSGFTAAASGIYLVSLLGTGNPIMGQGYELLSITPVVLGGTSLAGGKGGVWGTLFGVLLLALLNSLLNFLQVSTFYQWVVQGIIILAAVSIFAERRVIAR
jgi:ribose transport system permease protein